MKLLSNLSSLPLRARVRGVATPFIVALALGAGVGAAQAAEPGTFTHRVLMRGQILDKENGDFVVCVGQSDGAQVGQELDVVRHTRASRSSKVTGPRFRREEVGRVRIMTVFDQHYATAKLVEGKAQVNDSVELVGK